MAWSKFKLDEVVVRRTKLLELRRKGVRYDDDQVAALGYSSPSAARKDLNRALEAHRNEEAAEVGIYRQQENERLDDELSRLETLEAAARTVLGNRHIMVNNGRVILHPDTNQPMEDDGPILQAIDRLVKIEDARRRNGERRAKLNGLDMPVQAELSGPDGGAIPFSNGEASELLALIGISEQEHASDITEDAAGEDQGDGEAGDGDSDA
jgi:hypothetical protein